MRSRKSVEWESALADSVKAGSVDETGVVGEGDDGVGEV